MTLSKEGLEKMCHKVNLFAVYVTPRMRGHKIGEALLSEVIQAAKQLTGVEKINLTVVTTNKAAIHLYEKQGFKTYGLETRAMKNGDIYLDEQLMSLEW